jgi:membrane complex biogenesis BtpA family protein
MTRPSDSVPKPDEIQRLFGRRGALVGMLHLRPLPGAPRYRRDEGMTGVLDQALCEARILEDAGFDGVIVENGWDIPFVKPEDVGYETVAALSVVVDRIRQAIDLPVGINCLANAVEASIAVAAGAGGAFVRANQWANAYIANEGFIEGRAGVIARYRRAIGADHVTVWADVQVKLGSHALTADRSLAEQARDAAWFDADALIVTGSRLADPPAADDLAIVREATGLPVVVGSGVRADNLRALLDQADAVIIGSSLKEGGVWYGPMDKDSVLDLVRERDRVREGDRVRERDRVWERDRVREADRAREADRVRGESG